MRTDRQLQSVVQRVERPLVPHVTVPLVLQLEYTVAASEAHMAEAKHKAAHVSRATRGTEAALRVQSAQAAAQQRKDRVAVRRMLAEVAHAAEANRKAADVARKACKPPESVQPAVPQRAQQINHGNRLWQACPMMRPA